MSFKKILSFFMALTLLVTMIPNVSTAENRADKVMDVSQSGADAIIDDLGENAVIGEPGADAVPDELGADADMEDAGAEPEIEDIREKPEIADIGANTDVEEIGADVEVSEVGATYSGITGDCTWSLNGTVLTISGNGKMGDYNHYNYNDLPWGTEITKVVIKEGVESIGYYAFKKCKSLVSIEIPNSVTYIGSDAFYDCINLEYNEYKNGLYLGNKDNPYHALIDTTSENIGSFTFASSVVMIGSEAFYKCTSLTSIEIPGSVKSIGGSAFSNCTGLTSIKIPDSVENIENFTFDNCSNLKSIEIPGSVKSIGKYAFNYCSSLTSIEIPDSVESIGKYAFYYCSSLTSIEIPDSVESIGEGVFKGCSGLQSITIPFVGGSRKTSTDTYQYPFGYIFGTDSYTGGVATTQYYYGESTGEATSTVYYLPENLKSVTVTGGEILYSAFRFCKNLTSIEISDNVTYIGRYAFSGCSNLVYNKYENGLYLGNKDNPYYALIDTTSNDIESFTFASSVVVIGSRAFYNCTGLTSIEIPGSVKSIGDYAFEDCTNLTSVKILDGVEYIGNYMFYECSKLTSIEIPDSVKNVGKYAFYYCSSLTGIEFPGSVKFIADHAFNHCTSLTTVKINYGVESIGNYAFYYCSKLTSIEIPGSVKDIADHAFNHCTSLTTVKIDYGVESIGNYAFRYCDSLTSVEIPDSVECIGEGTFADCSNMQSITVPFLGDSRKNATGTGQYPLGYIFNVSYIISGESGTVTDIWYEIPKSLQSVTVTGGGIPSGAFEDGTGLTSIELPDGIESIGNSAFSGCTSLTSIEIPDSVESIGDYAFYGCKSLKSIELPGSVKSIGKYAFCHCTSLTSIDIPDSVVSIGEELFSYCSGLQSITIPFVGDSRKTSTDTYQYPLGYIFGTYSYTGGIRVTQKYYGSDKTSETSSVYYIPSSLKSVTVTDGEILSGAFYNCSMIKELNFGAGVSYITPDAFIGCSGLGRISVSDENPYYTMEHNTLYNKDKTEIIYVIKNFKPMLKVNLLYIDGTQALAPLFVKLSPQQEYSVPIPEIVGYSTKRDVVVGKIGNTDSSVDVIYYENPIAYKGQCGDSIKWTLYTDGTMVFTGTGDMPDYTAGAAPWYEYADKVSCIYIDSRITSIGDYAFEDCSNLTYIDYGYGVKSVGEYAFKDCASITAFKLPVSVKEIANGAFYGCTNLKSLSIPDNITSVDDYAFYGCTGLTQVTIGSSVTSVGQYAFADCSGLNRVYFRGEPVQLGEQALGSTEGKYVYYYSNVSGWSEEIVDGYWNGYMAVPYNAVSQQKENDNLYIIKVVDKYNVPIKNAMVYLGDKDQPTNEDGMAYFVKPEGSVVLSIGASGFVEFEDPGYTAGAGQLMDIIELSDSPVVVKGVSLDKTSIATSVGIINCSADATHSITVSGYATRGIYKYELYQNKCLIAAIDSENAQVTFSVKASSFEEAQTVVVKMYTKDGYEVVSALNIDVIKLGTISTEQIIGELSKIDLEFSAGDFGEYKIPMKFVSDGDEKVYTDIEGRTIRVGINLDVGKLFENNSEAVAKSTIQKLIDKAMKEFSKKDAGFGCGVSGYIELEYRGPGDFDVKVCYVKVCLSANLEFTANASYMGIVGVYFKAELSGASTVDLVITGFSPEEKFEVEMPSVTIENSLLLELGAYLLWGFGSAGVYGTLNMGFTLGMIPKMEMETVYISGELGIHWTVMWGIFSGDYPIVEGDLYRWPQNKNYMLAALSENLYDAMLDPDSYKLNDRSYLANRSEWLASTQDESYLQQNIYYNVVPEIVTCGDTTLMVWLDDNSNRSGSNYQTLYYSVYENGQWSAPVAVDDNGTFDCEFDLYTDGKEIYVIYSEMTQNIDTAELSSVQNENIGTIINSVEVYVSKFENGSFGTPVQLTDNESCEVFPTVSSVNGVLTAVWVNTDSMGISGESVKNDLYCSVLLENGWGTPVCVAENLNSISSVASVSLAGQDYNAYVIDSDGSAKTKTDQVLVLTDNGGSSVQLDTGMITGLKVSSVDEVNALSWYNNGQLYMVTDKSLVPVSLLPAGISTGTDYEIINMSENQTILSFVMDTCDDKERSSGIYIVYIDSNGYLTSPIRITDTEGYVTNYTMTCREGKLITVLTESFTDISQDSVNVTTHLKGFASECFTDLTLNSVSFDEAELAPATEMEVELSLTNNGMNIVDGITFDLYDDNMNLLYTTDMNDIDLMSGENRNVTVTVVLPAILEGLNCTFEVVPHSYGNTDDVDDSDNLICFDLTYIDIAVSTEQKIIGDNNYVVINVSNLGNVSTNAEIEVYLADEQGKLIVEFETGVIDAGKFKSYMVDVSSFISKDNKVVTCVATTDKVDLYTVNNKDTLTLMCVNPDSFAMNPDNIIENPELSVNNAEYDKYYPQDIIVSVSHIDEFDTIEGLEEGKDYYKETKQIIIYQSYLNTLALGENNLNFVFDFGNGVIVSRTFDVYVTDSAPVAVSGNIGIDGNGFVGETVYADVSGLIPSDAKLECEWYIGDKRVSSENQYTVAAEDINKTLVLKVKGTEGFTGEFEAQINIGLSKPDAPLQPVISEIQPASVVVVRAEGIEYTLDGVNFIDSGVFTDLLPDTTYKVYARKKATDICEASDLSIGVTFTTPKYTVSAPVAPECESSVYNTITLVHDSVLEYRIEGGDWTDNNVFTGLEPSTEYVFYQRVKETDTSYASDMSFTTIRTADLVEIRGSVSIAGKRQYGSELTVDLSKFVGDADNITYQWYREGQPIEEATQNTYAVTEDDMGCMISVIVSGENGFTGDLDAEAMILSYVPGDVNNDLVCDEKDVELLRDYAADPENVVVNEDTADFNDDGEINMMDVVILRRHLAGWQDYENLPLRNQPEFVLRENNTPTVG